MRVHARLFAAGTLVFALSSPLPAHQPSQQQPPPAQPPAGTAAQPPAGTPQQPPAGQRPPVIRSGINFVSVDVIVTDKKTGEVVLDMKPEDFDVREDKKPQRVDTFEVVKIDALTSHATVPKEIRNLDDEATEARQPNV